MSGKKEIKYDNFVPGPGAYKGTTTEGNFKDHSPSWK